MLVTVFCAPRDRPESTFALDVSPELELRDFVALCELESGIPAGEIQITYVEQPLKDPTRALGTYGVKDGDVVVLRQANRPPPTQPAFPGLPRIDFSSITVPGTSSSTAPRSTVIPPQQIPQQRQQQQQPQLSPLQQQQQQHQQQQQQPQNCAQTSAPTTSRGSTSPQGLDDPALLQQMLLSNPHELSLLKERNPPLAEALLSGDLERFTKVLLEQQQDRAKREQERIRLLTADPFDLDAQAKIEEDIRQHNVEENMTIAMEEAPESFGQVVMLYINCKVNGHPVKAFVDSGAQMTIMSQACAERCNIMRLVDRRWAGIAKGVGTQKIIGRVHLAQVQIEGDFLPCSFSILEDQPMDMLLGLDMLKRHQCSIDLKRNVLLIGTTGTETRFLSEAELPECARLAYGPEGREESRPEEIADRELAEALQRSIQESDTADGQTTSPQPQSSSLPTISDQMSSSTTHPSIRPSPGQQNQTLDLPQSSVVPLDKILEPGQCQDQDSRQEGDGSTPQQVPSNSVTVGPSQSAEALQCPDGGPVPGESTKVEDNSLHAEQVPMEQEVTGPSPSKTPETCPTDPNQSVEMEPPYSVSSSCREQPEGERCSSADSIPSLAAALMELHELLLSNTTPQLPTHLEDLQKVTPEAVASDAKAKPATAACEGPSGCLVWDGEGADSVEGPLEPPEGCAGQDEASHISICHPESMSPPDSDGDFRKPPEGQQGSEAAEGGASDSHLSPQVSSTSSCSSAAATPLAQPAPSAPFREQFPMEHIQRIQAAGFSAHDAAEALERAHGIVELALLALLARSITVPT
ncbi:protein DDI1 homolog 2 isoform X1 [Nerophis ophidion]|uniref:protein DDI1 homolog 2 isoform X1 n=1 Tax=Nerophis ophidion TaxID=159077 RepID=UPI002AE02C10|nr:protein DDI1 homolog 2 isoform X1 [Nerophis ophidion]